MLVLAALVLSTLPSPAEAHTELVASTRQGDPKALVATWESGDNDGVLGRALVRLAG